MTAKNDITGDEIKSKTNNDLFREGWERIFAKKEQPSQDEKEVSKEDTSKE
jgi:hypothetical protein